MNALPAVAVETRDRLLSLRFSGELTALLLAPVEAELLRCYDPKEGYDVLCDCTEVTGFDTAAALLLLDFKKTVETDGGQCRIELPQEEYRKLQALVERYRGAGAEPPAGVCTPISRLGRRAAGVMELLLGFFAFIGNSSAIFLSYLRSFRRIRYKEILFEINECAIKALGVVGLITFLIGVVVAYQSSLQLKLYGANIFIVDMLGIGIFRELSPLLVAVVVAGRSGSAYAAQIGVMKITEELDAMRTMGFDPYAFLVLPRLIALVLMMPLLIFFADMMGVLGGMIVSNIELGLSIDFFLQRFSDVIDIRHFWIGMVKGPFFGLLIASIGIYRGLKVENDTQSIGFNTTRSVVESIFAVIICDAIFSIVFTNLEL
jgi:phospholipid/cholesterol/gamma-HCH transport system permease protein